MIRERRPGLEIPFDGPSAKAYNSIAGIPLFRIERRMIMREIAKYYPAGALLDIGCGPGQLTVAICRKFPALKVIGLDISPDMLELAQRNLTDVRAEFVLGDVQSLPLEDSSVNFVISSGSLHHWDDASAAFGEIHRALKSGGRFLVMDLRRDAPELVYVTARVFNLLAPGELRRTNGALGSLYTAYTPGELETLLSQTPFKNVEIKTGFAWMFVTAIK